MYVNPELLHYAFLVSEPSLEAKFRAEERATRPARPARVRRLLSPARALEAKLVVAGNIVRAGRFFRFA
jgi:hypothetical protein